jgi:hypothetical protein
VRHSAWLSFEWPDTLEPTIIGAYVEQLAGRLAKPSVKQHLISSGTIEKAQQIAAHESLRTPKLYDRTNDEITLDEVERIAI